MVSNTIIDLKRKTKLKITTLSEVHTYILVGTKLLILKYFGTNEKIKPIFRILLKNLTISNLSNDSDCKYDINRDFSWINENSIFEIVAQDLLGEIYSYFLPKKWKNDQGYFLTPFHIAKWMILESEILQDPELSKKTVMDPCVGTGRFLLSLFVLLNDSNNLKNFPITNITGFDQDPFSVFICRINLSLQYLSLLQIVDYSKQINVVSAITNSIKLQDFLNPSISKLDRYLEGQNEGLQSLDKIFSKIKPFEDGLNYIFCNPPYNKIQLSKKQQSLFQKSIYGHVNAYAVFLHLCINLSSENGRISFIIPESFRSGLYFKNLRKFLLSSVNINKIVLIHNRTGVFENVLQGLGIFQFQKTRNVKSDGEVIIYTINTSHDLISTKIKNFVVNKKRISHYHGEEVFFVFGEKLESYEIYDKTISNSIPFQDFCKGLEITTGQIVWNRLKKLLKDENTEILTKDDYPLIWSDNYDSFTYLPKGKIDRKRFISLNRKIEKFLLKDPVILVKRVTAKEQPQRIIATITPENLPNFFVENHSNIISSQKWTIIDKMCILGYLNSSIANFLFTLLNGNTQVSATELRALPFPKMTEMQMIELSSKVNKILYKNIMPKERNLIISEINGFFYMLFGLPEALQNEISNKLGKTL